MRYSVLGGAFQVSVPDRRGSIQTRPWLLHAAADCVAAPSRWLRSAPARRSMVAIVLGATAIGAGAGARVLQQRSVAGVAGRVATATIVDDIPSVRWGYAGARTGSGVATAQAAQSTVSALARPGYTLSATATQALDAVRLTVADAAVMQQLRAQIDAPAIPSALSGPALSQLIALVQQSQMASAATAGAAGDPVQIAQAETSVRAAQQTLAAATKARDDAASATPGAAAGTPAAPATAAATAAVMPATTTAAAGTPIAAAQARLAAANAHLAALLAVPSQAQIAAAQKAVQDALDATPKAPSANDLAAAQAAVTSAQKAYDAAQQGPSRQAVSSALASAEGRATPSVSGAQHTTAAAAAPVAKPGEKPEDTVNRLVHGPDPQQLADLQANIDSAKAALAALQQQAVSAADPSSQPAVLQARKALATLTAPPDSTAVSAAQAEVAAAQQALAALQPAAGTAASPVSAAPAALAPGFATAVAPAATPGSAAAPAPITATTAATAAPTATAAAAATPGASAAGAGAAAPADPVAVAQQQLSDAQHQLQALIAGGTTSTTPLPAGSSSIVALPTGSTSTALTPAILAAAAQVPMGAASQSQLTTVEVALRARYVADSVLAAAHLHPSALVQPAIAAFGATSPPAGSAAIARPLAWPVIGPITQPFGVPELGVGTPHTGVDIGVPVGTPVQAAASGVVSFAGGDPSTGYGYYAIIDHGGGVSTLYGHLALPPLLHTGQFLPQGGLIGLSGSTGFSTGPHVHFEVRLNGTPVDPLKILQAATPH